MTVYCILHALTVYMESNILYAGLININSN